MIVYKSVEVLRNGARASAFCHRRKSLQLCYPKGKEVTPKIGECFAFDTLEHAKDFAWGNEVWEAETPEVKSAPIFIYTDLLMIADYLKQFWASLSTVTLFTGGRPPDGTVLCPSLKLIKRVTRRIRSVGQWRDDKVA